MDFQYREMRPRIKIRRKELKIKQAEMAKALAISNNHMPSIENGRKKPSLDIFIGICKYRIVPWLFLSFCSFIHFSPMPKIHKKLSFHPISLFFCVIYCTMLKIYLKRG